MTTDRIIFDRPPINEVVIATYFDPPLADLRSQHIGIFWNEIKGDFPVVRQQIPVGAAPDIGLDEPFPMPRYWFIARDEINLVQLQKNAFMLNWRRRGQNQYPGFQDIKLNFDGLLGKFENFLSLGIGISEVPIALCELTYIDAIEECEYWRGPSDTGKVIRSFQIPLADSSISTSGFDCRYSYQAEEEISLSTRIWTMVRPGEPGRTALGIEMKTIKRFEGVPKTATDDWFRRAHDTMLRHFLDITSEDIQREYWGLRTEEPR